MLVNPLFTEARRALERGDLAYAEHCSGQLLQLLPENADVWLLTGDILEARERFESAIEFFTRVQRQHSKDPAIHVRLGQCLARAGRADEAAKSFRKALKLKPVFMPALGSLGLLALQAGQFDEASMYFERILKINPGDVSSWLNLGNVRFEQQRWGEAEKCFARVTALAPDFAGAYNNLGNVLVQQGRYAEAAASYRRSTELGPENAEFWLNLGDVLHGLRDWEGAEAAYERALNLNPRHDQSYRQIGKLMLDLHRPSDAVHYYRRLLGITSGTRDIWIAMAKGYLDAAQSGAGFSRKALEGIGGEPIGLAGSRRAAAMESLKCSECALRLKLNDPDALCNKGAALRLLDRLDEVEETCRAVIANQANYAQAHFDLSSLLLSRSRFLEGWKNYPWRMKLHNVPSALPEIPAGLPELPVPLDFTRGTIPTNLAGKRILVVWDQGIGDEVFFTRFLPLLKAQGAWVAYWPSSKIRSVLGRVDSLDMLVDKSSIPAPIDMIVTIGDLPCLLAEANAQPPIALIPKDARVQALREALMPPYAGKPLLGVTWRAGWGKHGGVAAGMNKQVLPGKLGQCLAAWKGEFVILQRDPRPEEIREFEEAIGRPAIDASELNDDLEGMLALLALLEDYVGVSNTNMHLRAGLGLRARVLVSHPADWRWMAEGASSPWFPDFLLYRESLDTGWDEVLARLARDIA